MSQNNDKESNVVSLDWYRRKKFWEKIEADRAGREQKILSTTEKIARALAKFGSHKRDEPTK